MNTIFSRGMPSCGISFCTAAKIAKSPQPGHQRTSWSLTKSLRVSIGPEAGSIVSSSFCSAMLFAPVEQRFDPGLDLGDLERLSLDLVEADGRHQELGAQHLEQLAHVHLGHEHVLEVAQD